MCTCNIVLLSLPNDLSKMEVKFGRCVFRKVQYVVEFVFFLPEFSVSQIDKNACVRIHWECLYSTIYIWLCLLYQKVLTLFRRDLFTSVCPINIMVPSKFFHNSISRFKRNTICHLIVQCSFLY